MRDAEATPISNTSTPLQSAISTRSPSTQPLANSRKLQAPQARSTKFEPRASIVLVGSRGAGKSTLAVLAATAYNLRPLEVERQFLEATGSTVSAYRKLHGIDEFRKRHHDVLKDTLTQYGSGAVIVCSLTDLDGDGAASIQRYAQNHPVIHVKRDAKDVQSYLSVWTIEQVKKLATASENLLRSCSNFEFYNITEASHLDGELGRQKFLTLKRVERDFLRLLRNIVGDHSRRPSHQSAYPLSQIPIEDRSYTSAVTVNCSHVIKNRLDLETAQVGADCIQLVIDKGSSQPLPDLDAVSEAFAIIRRASILPVWLNVQVDSALDRTDQLHTTEHCLRLGPELCTIDLSLQEQYLREFVSSKAGSRLVASCHFSERPFRGWNDAACLEAYQRAARLGFEIIEITMDVESIDEAFEIQSLRHRVQTLEMNTKLSAFNTGRKGPTSKCFNKILTPVRPPKEPTDTSSTQRDEDGSITSRDITESLFATFIVRPKHFFIFGADVSYSLSPAMHNASYEACGMRYKYTAHSSGDPDDFDKLVQSPDFGGTAITQPFKTQLVSRMDGLSRHAKAIGAVNTIVPVYDLTAGGGMPDEVAIITQRSMHGSQKALFGYNTDWIGIRSCLRRGLSPANAIRPSSSALVCGAGGMARAAIYSLLSLGVRNILICNRTYQKAVEMAEHYNKLVRSGEISDLVPNTIGSVRIEVLNSLASAWPDDMRQPTMIVCCVPRRMADGSPTNFSLPETWLSSSNGGVCVEVFM